MTFGEFKNTEEYIEADVVSFVDTNGEEMDIEPICDSEDMEILDSIEVVETHKDGGYLEITLNWRFNWQMEVEKWKIIQFVL